MKEGPFLPELVVQGIPASLTWNQQGQCWPFEVSSLNVSMGKDSRAIEAIRLNIFITNVHVRVGADCSIGCDKEKKNTGNLGEING